MKNNITQEDIETNIKIMWLYRKKEIIFFYALCFLEILLFMIIKNYVTFISPIHLSLIYDLTFYFMGCFTLILFVSLLEKSNDYKNKYKINSLYGKFKNN